MKAPAVSVNATAVLALAGVAVLGWLGWRAYRAVSGSAGAFIAGAAESVEQGAADVSQWFGNAFSAPAVQSWKAALYSDESYTGADPATGQIPTDGEWFGNESARRYEYEQRDKGAAPAATSNNGAAFGIYPKP